MTKQLPKDREQTARAHGQGCLHPREPEGGMKPDASSHSSAEAFHTSCARVLPPEAHGCLGAETPVDASP